MLILVTSVLLVAVLVDGAPSYTVVTSSATSALTSALQSNLSSIVVDNQHAKNKDREQNVTLEERKKINSTKSTDYNLNSLNFSVTTAGYEREYNQTGKIVIDKSAPKLHDSSNFEQSNLYRSKQIRKLLKNVPQLHSIFQGSISSNITEKHNTTRDHQMSLIIKTFVGDILSNYRQHEENVSTNGNKTLESNSTFANYKIHQRGKNLKPLIDFVRLFEIEHPTVRKRIRQKGNEMDHDTPDENDLRNESNEDSEEMHDTFDLSDYIISVLEGKDEEEDVVGNDKKETYVEPNDVFNHQEIRNNQKHTFAADHSHNRSPNHVPEINEASVVDTAGKLENSKLEKLLWKDFFTFEIPDKITRKKEISYDSNKKINQYHIERNNGLEDVYEYDDGDDILGNEETLDYSDEEVHDYVDEDEERILNSGKLSSKAYRETASKNTSPAQSFIENVSKRSENDESLESQDYVDESKEKPWKGSLWNSKRVGAEDGVAYTNTIREVFHKSNKNDDPLLRREIMYSDENQSDEYYEKGSEEALLSHPNHGKDIPKAKSFIKLINGNKNLRKSSLSWISEHKELFKQNEWSSRSNERDDDRGSAYTGSEEIGSGPLIFHNKFAHFVAEVAKSANRNWKHRTQNDGSYEHLSDDIYSASEEDKSISSEGLLPIVKHLTIPKPPKKSEGSKVVHVHQPKNSFDSASYYRNFFNKRYWERWDHNRYTEESKTYHRENNDDDSSEATPKVNNKHITLNRIVHKSIQDIPTIPPKPQIQIQRQPTAPPPPQKPKLQIHRIQIIPPPAPSIPKLLPPTPPKPAKMTKVQKLKIYVIPHIRKPNIPMSPPPHKPTRKHLLFRTVQLTKPKKRKMSPMRNIRFKKMSTDDALENEIMKIDLQKAWTNSYQSNLRKQYYKKNYDYKRPRNRYGYRNVNRTPRNSYDSRTSYGNMYRRTSHVPYKTSRGSGYRKMDHTEKNNSLYAQRFLSSHSAVNHFNTHLNGRNIRPPSGNTEKDCNNVDGERNLHFTSYSPHQKHKILQQNVIRSSSLYPTMKTLRY